MLDGKSQIGGKHHNKNDVATNLFNPAIDQYSEDIRHPSVVSRDEGTKPVGGGKIPIEDG